MRVRGVGVLLLGASGVGKSEIALELITRGHQLAADDVVELRAEAGRLYGQARPPIRHFLEIRGLGILCVPDLYGEHAVVDEAAVDLVCRLETWRPGASYERVGLERAAEALLGVELPAVVLPVRASANMATLVEAAVRDHIQRARGPSGAARLDARLREEAPQ